MLRPSLQGKFYVKFETLMSSISGIFKILLNIAMISTLLKLCLRILYEKSWTRLDLRAEPGLLGRGYGSVERVSGFAASARVARCTLVLWRGRGMGVGTLADGSFRRTLGDLQ